MMATETRATYSAERVRDDFPLLTALVNGHPVAYLDSAATSQKPRVVLDAIRDYYCSSNANVHRGVHTLGNSATDVFENGRTRIAQFINAPRDGVVFVRNTTEAVNLVASSYAREMLKPGDRIVVTEMEHHSNLVPWQLAAQRGGLTLEAIRVGADGRLDMDDAARLLSTPTALLAVTHQSNVLGTINDIPALSAMAHAAGARVFVDAAQSVPHMSVDVAALGCDFLAFSSHKMGGPMGGGVLWGDPALLDSMPPYQGGGSMIVKVALTESTWAELPHKFEAGTPDVAAVAGLVAACDYLEALGWDAIAAHERRLTERLLRVLDAPDITIHGPRTTVARGGCVSFTMEGVHAHDIGTILDREGVEVRAGHHCCQPLMRHLGVAATARASTYVYTTDAEVDAFAAALDVVRGIFSA